MSTFQTRRERLLTLAGDAEPVRAPLTEQTPDEPLDPARFHLGTGHTGKVEF